MAAIRRRHSVRAAECAAMSPPRTAAWFILGTAIALQSTVLHAEDEAMLRLAWDSGCFNCHDLHEQVRGPAWTAVAERYREDDEALERLVQRVIQGGGGNWGEDVMSPNRRVPEEHVRTLVAWLLNLE
jgi:cytochrome c